MSLMRLRGVWPANAAAMLIGMGMYASFLIIPEFVQAPARLGYGFGASVTGAGLFMFPTAAAQLLLGPASAMLQRRVSLRAQLIVGQLTCAAGFASLVLRNAGGALGSQLAAAIIVSSARAGAPAASGYIGALILCATATCAGAFVACATPRKDHR
jgi:hypothetical protein